MYYCYYAIWCKLWSVCLILWNIFNKFVFIFFWNPLKILDNGLHVFQSVEVDGFCVWTPTYNCDIGFKIIWTEKIWCASKLSFTSFQLKWSQFFPISAISFKEMCEWSETKHVLKSKRTKFTQFGLVPIEETKENLERVLNNYYLLRPRGENYFAEVKENHVDRLTRRCDRCSPKSF